MIRTALLAFIISIAFFTAAAYDFAAENEDGTVIYYNITGENVQVTYERLFVTADYHNSRINVPEAVNYQGTSYPVTSIGEYAFFSSALDGISLPESLTSIGDFAFAGCTHLEKILLPAGVTSLGLNVFDGCFSMTDIDVAGDNPAFKSVSGVIYDKSGKMLVAYPQGRHHATISPASEYLAPCAFYGCSLLTDISLPQGVRAIGDNAFYFCGGLSYVSLPASVISIGRSAFADCMNLAAIHVNENNPAYCSAEGSLLDKEAKILLQSPAARIGSCAIPPTVNAISDLAFFRNIGVTTAIIPEGVAIVGEGAFTGCQSLSAVTLPLSLKEIGNLAFALCPALEAVYVANPDPAGINMPSDAFTGIDADRCLLYVPAGSLEAYAAAQQWCGFKTIVEYDALAPQQIVWDTEYAPDGPDYVTVTLDAEATSGLPVAYTLAPECVASASISGNILTMLTRTKVKVTATQDGNGTYAPAEPVTRTIEATDALDGPIDDSSVRVLGGMGKIIIFNADNDETARVYDIAGHTVYIGTEHTIKVPSGHIYIVDIGGHAFKVHVK